MRVLIADDDATSRLVLRALVSRQGHECLIAEDGSRAWDLLSSSGIEVLLTDWMMPGVDGPELCRRVRRELRDQYVYIVLVTGLGNPDQVLAGMNAGADDYLIKPVDPFAVHTRLIAAERVTSLHSQVADFRHRLEQANIELLGMSLTDALTGLGNRREMETDLARAHAQATRTGEPYAVALFDIDHFKLYNDHYGHLAGDAALQDVARCLDARARAGERAYRYGGEEFLLLITRGDAGDASTAAQRICTALAEVAIPHEATPNSPHVLTLSAGVSCFRPGSPTTVQELLQGADTALYQAKSEGRNCVAAPT